MLRNVGHSGLRGFGGSPRSGAARRPDGRRRSTFLQLTGAVLFLEPQTLEQRLFDRRRPLRERTPPGGQSIPVIISSQKSCSIVVIFLGFDPVERLASNSEKSSTRRAHPASDFVNFTAKRFVRSSWSQKQIYKTFQFQSSPGGRFIAARFENETPSSVVEPFVAIRRRIGTATAIHSAAQRTHRRADVGALRSESRRHAEGGTRPHSVTVSHSAQPLSLVRTCVTRKFSMKLKLSVSYLKLSTFSLSYGDPWQWFNG